MIGAASPDGHVGDVASILVMGPDAIGDFVFALPALLSLRAAYPEAHLVLLGKPWHQAFLHDRPGPVDEVVLMPPYPGMGQPEGTQADPAARAVVDGLRARGFDIALQMYGGGRYSNGFIRALSARVCAGTTTPDAPALDRMIAYRSPANRRLQLLQVAALVGAPATMPWPELIVTDAERAAAAQTLPQQAGECIVVVHPGVSDPRRRWPAARLAAVADGLADAGAAVVVSAGPDDMPIAADMVTHMRQRPACALQMLSMPALLGILERACMVVSNDTGPLHLALAVGTPAVGVFWLTNLIEGAPLRTHTLSAALSVRTHCPVCGVENVHHRCGHDVSFVDDVTVDEVTERALDMFREVS